MIKNTKTSNVVHLLPECNSTYPTTSNLYRVCMHGNIEELVIGTMLMEDAKRIIGLPQSDVDEIVFGNGATKSFIRYGGKADPMYQLPSWYEVEEQYRISGLIVDKDLRVHVEDADGNILDDLTSFIAKNGGRTYANDNAEVYELGSYNGLNPNDPLNASNATAGVFNARSFERGVFYYTFEIDEAPLPWDFSVPLQDMTTHYLTTQALYNGYPALGFDAHRWTVKPPQASVDYAKAA